jgi:hypothetical protein
LVEASFDNLVSGFFRWLGMGIPNIFFFSLFFMFHLTRQIRDKWTEHEYLLHRFLSREFHMHYHGKYVVCLASLYFLDLLKQAFGKSNLKSQEVKENGRTLNTDEWYPWRTQLQLKCLQ